MDHITAKLQAYHDGELEPRTAKIVEHHLTECEACRSELEALETLSSLLHEVAPAALQIPEDRFAAQVVLRLPRKRAPTLPERTLKWGWRVAPVALVALWGFLQAATILTTGINTLLQLGVGSRQLELLLPGTPTGSAMGRGLVNGLLNALGIEAATGIPEHLVNVGWSAFVPLLFAALTALAIGSWVAMWWATQRTTGSRQGLQETS